MAFGWCYDVQAKPVLFLLPCRLFCCAEVGLLESAQLLLERGTSVAAADAHGLTALMFATRLEHGVAAPCVRLLLSHGASAVVNAQVSGAWGHGVTGRRARARTV